MELFKINANTDNASEIIDILVFMGCELLATKEQLLNEIGLGYAKLCESGNGVFTSKAEYNSLKEIALPELLDMVVLKRNSIDDASFKDTFGDFWYVDSTNSYWMFENGIWREAEKPLFKLEPIKKYGEVKMKEYLELQEDGSYNIVLAYRKEGNNWIEVPEGAEEYRSNYKFYKNNGGLYYSSYDEWVESGIYPYKTLWQRKHTTPNTATQDKLKFIEKWLNGEKIQYILGVESDKTQWHNFTEGAMQYIKRSDIKFREAPKYVTINGIEFKSVESLLKYVKNNFDLEDGE